MIPYPLFNSAYVLEEAAMVATETAAATAQPSSSRAVIGLASMRAQTQEEMTAARWTTGPSRPEEPPEPSVIIEASAEASPALFSTRPSRRAGNRDPASESRQRRPSWAGSRPRRAEGRKAVRLPRPTPPLGRR